MKKVYLSILLIPLVFTLQAATIEIQVVDNQFNPGNVNVVVGDVVRFNFSGGSFHNASSIGVTNGVPSGAADIYSGTPGAVATFYDYPVTHVGTYKYVCEAHGDPSTFTGMVGQFVASPPLPALIKDFMVVVSGEKKPFISWKTLNETNVRHFIIRSSTDGVNFRETSVLQPEGNSSGEQLYRYTDYSVTPRDKYVYYHLAIIDLDGSEKRTEIKVFRNPVALQTLITQMGPNPITKPQQLMLNFNADRNGVLQVKVFDATGKQVMESNMKAFPGINNGHLHLCDLNPGIYTLQFSLDGLFETKRVVVN